MSEPHALTDPATRRILQGPLAWEVLRFGLPLATAMGLQTTFNLVDAYVIARLDPTVVGPSLGAIGICDQIAAIGTIISYGVSIATAAMLSQRHGRGDRDGAVRVAWQSMLVVGVLSLLFAALGLFASDFVMRGLVGAKGQVADLGVAYLRIIVGGSFSIFFLLQLTSIQRAFGSSKTPVVLMVSSNIINLVLAVLLVYGPGEAPSVFSWGPPIARLLHLPRMELLGAAWATVIARTVVLLPLIVVIEMRFHLFRRLPRPLLDTQAMRRLLGIAWPASVQFVVRILAMLLTHSLVARTFTTSQNQQATTALGIVFRLETLALFVAMGWGSAAQTFFGQNQGAGQSKRALSSGWIAFAYNSVLMLFLIWAFRSYGGQVVGFFDSEAPVVEMSLGYLKIVAPSYFALGGGIVLGNAITASGATKMTLLVDLCVVALVQVPLSLWAVMGSSPSMIKLWWAVALTSCVSALVYVVVYRRARFLKGAAL